MTLLPCELGGFCAAAATCTVFVIPGDLNTKNAKNTDMSAPFGWWSLEAYMLFVGPCIIEMSGVFLVAS